MSVHNGTLIQPPVSIRDVQTVLGHSSGDLATLITNGNINKWAKYKPIVKAKVGVISNTDRKNANYGITNIPVWSGNGAVNKMGNFWFGVNTTDTNLPTCGRKTEYWAYERPTGGSSAPYRLSDFAEAAGSAYGYKSDADPPIGGVILGTATISPKGEFTIDFWGNGTGQGDGYSVPVSELTGVGVTFGNLYMSFMLHKTGSSTYYVASRPNIWQNDNSTSISSTIKSKNVGVGLEGLCEVFPFLSTKCFSALTSSLSGETGPCVAMFEKSSIRLEINYIRADVSGFVAYYESTSDKSLSYQFSLANSVNDIGFYAQYTVEMSSEDTFPSDKTVSVTVKKFIAKGATELVSGNITLQSQTALTYKNGYARVIVTVDTSHPEIIFYEDTSAAANIVEGKPK